MPRILDQTTRAYISAGLVRPIDAVFSGALIVEAMTVLYWRIFGSPDAAQLVVILLATTIWCLFWVALLVLRIGVIALEVRADIKLMPYMAAKLAHQLRIGDAPTDKKV